MKKSEIRKIASNVLARYGYTIIKPSIYFSEDKTAVLFYAFDNCGEVSHFYINFDIHYAVRQYMSIVTIHDSINISEWFF